MNTPVAHTHFIDAPVERLGGLRDLDIGATLRRWVDERPEALAFLHKRRGRWHAFLRSYVAREVERLAAILKERAGSGEIRLAATGLYEPDLIILALAAFSSGGQVFLLHGGLRGDALSRTLSTIRPTHAFVQGRRTVAQWLAAAPAGTTRLPLFSTQAFVGGNSAWEIVPLHDPAAAIAASPALNAWPWTSRPRSANIAWIDEGTEWHDGLRRLFDRSLHDGFALAFPETAESAVRDRRQIQPTTLILSPVRQRRLDEEDRARRSPEGSFGRRLVDRAEAVPGGALARFINRRRNLVLGLGRVQLLERPEPTPAPAPASV